MFFEAGDAEDENLPQIIRVVVGGAEDEDDDDDDDDDERHVPEHDFLDR